jgi:regulator of protease activity HflC (stomatin/prohibitin superfamily)
MIEGKKIFYLGMSLLIAISVLMAGCPVYDVWSQEMKGKAELARAESNRQISVFEAQAKKDSAKLLADAEIERAKGVAEANKIIGISLKDNEEYLRYLWIDTLHHNENNKIIYIPTEAGLPILEANRIKK